MLKDTPRSGWLTIGIKDAESVAEHSFRTALVGWILAKMEGASEETVIKMCLLHDLEEARIGDVHAVGKMYLKETRSAYKDAFRGLFCEKEMAGLVSEMKAGKTREAVLANDADKLEMIFQAKEYSDLGNPYSKEWIKKGMSRLKSNAAKKVAKEVIKRDSRKWLFEVKKRV